MTFDSIPAPTPIIHYLAHHLRDMLPPPLLDTDDEWLRRDTAAIAVLAELAPLTVVEAEQAAIVVAGSAHAMECLRWAGKVGDGDVRLALKCVAQAAGMFRQSEAARRRLAKLQVGRATPATDAEADAAAPSVATGGQPAGRSVASSTALGAALGAAGATDDADAKALAEAEAFARQSPRRAIHIRRLGCVPKGITYTPPRPAVVRALVTGQTPALRKLDRKVA